MKKNTKCLYCKQIKIFPQDFNAEHVIPESLGLFGVDTMTLNDLVCKDCNQYFGDFLELSLGRDSVFGILYRSISGVINPKEFEKSIRHKRKRIEPYRHSEYGELLVDVQLNSEKNFNVIIANQIVVLNSTKGNRICFRSRRLPHKAQIVGLGLNPRGGYIQFFSRSDNISSQVEEFNTALKKSEINIQVYDHQFQQFRFSEKIEPVYFKSVIDLTIQRALAKIAFNYFACKYPRSIVWSDSFNEIAHFIRYGLRAYHYLMVMDNKPLMTNLIEVNDAIYGRHSIRIYQNGLNHKIICQVILFNKISYEIILSRSYPLLGFPIQSSIFDIHKKTVIQAPSF